MKQRKSPFILVGALILLVGAVFASRGLGGKVGTAEELNAQYEEEMKAKMATSANDAMGEARTTEGAAVAADVTKMMKTRTPDGLAAQSGPPRRSLLREQKPESTSTKVAQNPSLPGSQWYRDEAYKDPKTK